MISDWEFDKRREELTNDVIEMFSRMKYGFDDNDKLNIMDRKIRVENFDKMALIQKLG